MLEGSTIAAVVPCYNEAHRIHDVPARMPTSVDCTIILGAAISLEAPEMIDLHGLYPRHGYPNDLLVRLNVHNFGVADVLSLLVPARLPVLWTLAAHIPEINALVWAVTFTSSTQFALFGMWFDMEMNRHLNPDSRLTPAERRAGRAAILSESDDRPDHDDPPSAEPTETHGADQRDVPAR